MPDATPSAPEPAAPTSPAPASPAPGATATPPAPQPNLAEQFASLQRKERLLVERQQAWKTEQTKAAEQLQAEKAALADALAKVKSYEEAKLQAKADPLGYLKAADLTYDDVTTVQLLDGKVTPDLVARQVQDEVKRLRAELAAKEEDARKKAAADAETAKQTQAKAEAAAVQQWMDQTTEAVKAAGDKYEFLNMLGVQAEVAQGVKAVYEERGQLIPWEEAAAKLEAFYQNIWEKGLQTKWYKGRSASAPPASLVVDDTAEPEVKVFAPTPDAETFDKRGLTVTGERKGEQRVAIGLGQRATPSSTSSTPAPVGTADRWEQIKAQFKVP